MKKYGQVINEVHGFRLMTVVDIDADGNEIVVGFVILNPDGSEFGQFSSYEEALEEFKQLTTDDDMPSAPRP